MEAKNLTRDQVDTSRIHLWPSRGRKTLWFLPRSSAEFNIISINTATINTNFDTNTIVIIKSLDKNISIPPRHCTKHFKCVCTRKSVDQHKIFSWTFDQDSGKFCTCLFFVAFFLIFPFFPSSTPIVTSSFPSNLISHQPYLILRNNCRKSLGLSYLTI